MGSIKNWQSTSGHLFKTFLWSWSSSYSSHVIWSFRRLAYGSAHSVNCLRLSDEMIRIAVGFRLGQLTCEQHICSCGKEVDARGLHGLSCRRSTTRQQCHADFNDIIWRAIKRAQIPVAKEQVGYRWEMPRRCWSCGKPLAWDVTVPDTFAESYLKQTSILTGRRCKQSHKTQTYEVHNHNFYTHICTNCKIETSGMWNNKAIEIVQEIGKRNSKAINDPNETMYLFQRLSVSTEG